MSRRHGEDEPHYALSRSQGGDGPLRVVQLPQYSHHGNPRLVKKSRYTPRQYEAFGVSNSQTPYPKHESFYKDCAKPTFEELMTIYFDSGEGASHQSQFRSKALYHQRQETGKGGRQSDDSKSKSKEKSEKPNNTATIREEEITFRSEEERRLEQEEQIIKKEDDRRDAEDMKRGEEDLVRGEEDELYEREMEHLVGLKEQTGDNGHYVNVNIRESEDVDKVRIVDNTEKESTIRQEIKTLNRKRASQLERRKQEDSRRLAEWKTRECEDRRRERELEARQLRYQEHRSKICEYRYRQQTEEFRSWVCDENERWLKMDQRYQEMQQKLVDFQDHFILGQRQIVTAISKSKEKPKTKIGQLERYRAYEEKGRYRYTQKKIKDKNGGYRYVNTAVTTPKSQDTVDRYASGTVEVYMCCFSHGQAANKIVVERYYPKNTLPSEGRNDHWLIKRMQDFYRQKFWRIYSLRKLAFAKYVRWEHDHTSKEHCWIVTANTPIMPYKDKASRGAFELRLKEHLPGVQPWTAKLDRLIEQAIPERQCIIWIELFEGPNTSYLWVAVIFVLLGSAAFGTAYALLNKTVGDAFNIASFMLTSAGLCLAFVSAREYLGIEGPDSYAWAYDDEGNEEVLENYKTE